MEEQARNICIAIGKRIRSIRHERRMTLDEMANKTGFAKSYLSQIETLKREPPISTLTKIAFVLGVDVLFLISGEAGRGRKTIHYHHEGLRKKGHSQAVGKPGLYVSAG